MASSPSNTEDANVAPAGGDQPDRHGHQIPLEGLHPLGPIYEGIALNVTLISREDAIDFGLVGCEERLPDLAPMAGGLVAALEALRKAVDHRDAH